MSRFNNVLHFGADPTGRADSTAPFQAALDDLVDGTPAEGSCLYVPIGTYKIEGTVVVRDGRTLEAQPGCRFWNGDEAETTVPMFQGLGRNWVMDFGGALIRQDRGSPDGIISAGYRLSELKALFDNGDPVVDPVDSRDWRVSNVTLVGAVPETPVDVADTYQPELARGLVITSPRPFGSDSAITNERGLVEDVSMRGVTDAVLITDTANFHQFNNIRIESFATSAFVIRGSNSNTIRTGGINSALQPSETCIRIEPKLWPAYTPGGQSNYNHIDGLKLSTARSGWTGVLIGTACQYNFVEFGMNAVAPTAFATLNDDKNTVVEGREANMLRLTLTDLEVFASNAAAAALPTGRLYRTATGEVRAKY